MADSRVYPRLPDQAALTVYRKARFDVVQTSQNHVKIAVNARAQVPHNVAVEEVHLAGLLQRHFLDAQSRRFRFLLARVLHAKQNRPAEIGNGDSVHVAYQDISHAQKGEIFQRLIADSARADNQYAGVAEFLLTPSLNPFLTVKGIVF